MAKVARDNGLGLNVDSKGMMGTMRLPDSFSQRDVRVQTAIGPDSAMVLTNGTFLPNDTQLVDQLALLSIASKHRLRGLIEDASRLAKGRQTGSHGIIPEDWADAAAENTLATVSVVAEGAPRSGWESAISPHSKPLKRTINFSRFRYQADIFKVLSHLLINFQLRSRMAIRLPQVNYKLQMK